MTISNFFDNTHTCFYLILTSWSISFLFPIDTIKTYQFHLLNLIDYIFQIVHKNYSYIQSIDKFSGSSLLVCRYFIRLGRKIVLSHVSGLFWLDDSLSIYVLSSLLVFFAFFFCYQFACVHHQRYHKRERRRREMILNCYSILPSSTVSIDQPDKRKL
jgi:hypothetical protein